jgi:phage tail-like protein
MIPERNNYWLLDAVAGWQMTPLPGQGDITLDPLPGNAVLLPSSLVNSIACPAALAADGNGRVFVMDGVTNRITILNLSNSRTSRIEAFGRVGSEARRFKKPQSLTVLPSGAIAIADTGNRRVQLFSGPPYALLRVWGESEISMKPVAIASDPCGVVYIADEESHTILRVSRTGEWLEPIGAAVLTNPVELAVAQDGTVAVVDGIGVNASIIIFPPTGAKPVALSLVKSPLSLAFDGSGNLYAGTANAIIAKLQPDTSQLSGWSLGGEGVSDYDGSIAKVRWAGKDGIVGILNSATPGDAPRLLSMDPAGAYRLTGSFATNSLDSNIEACTWHRVRVMGTVPIGTSVSITSCTSDDNDNWSPMLPCAVLTGKNPDCLVQSPPGQFLRLAFTLQSIGTDTPRIHGIQVFFPRQSYLQYLPSVFQDDDESRLFLDRFLSIFQTTFDGLDNRLDNLWQVFDPLMTHDSTFPWLAAWLALPIDPAMELSQQRKLLKNAFQTYLVRGTIQGLQQLIQAYTGIDNIRILEHFKLRNWTFLRVSGELNEGARLWSQNFYARLQLGVQSTVGAFRLTNAPAPASEPYDWGANQFTVLFPANPYTFSDTAAAIQSVLDREKPAHTQAFLSPLFPRLRVGVQATLGVDAYVGKANAMILGKLATLNYDAVLARSQSDRHTQALALSLYPRLGEDARPL